MARRVKVEVGALNIRMHPHPDGRYAELIDAIFALKRIIRVHGDRSALTTQLSKPRGINNYITGTITTFLNIDLDGPWFNALTLSGATDTDLSRVSVPEHLHPNVSSFYFRFDFDKHMLIFERYGSGRVLTHNFALKYITQLVNQPEIVEDFGDIKVSIVQSPGSLDRIFQIERITKLTIYIEKPNSDVWPDDFEELAEQHLEDKNARSMTIIYDAERGSGINRDADLDKLLGASLRNGSAEASGYGQSGHESVSTDKYPKTVQDKFDPDLMSESQMFENLAERFPRERG